MSRDVLTIGSTIRISLLYRGEYSQWVERFINYLEEQTDGEAMINSIKNGDQPLPRVTQVSIARNTSTEQPPLKDKSMWSGQEKRVQKIDLKMSRYVLTVGFTMRIPLLYRGEYSQWSESNKTAKDLWDALASHMLGFEYDEQDRKAVVLYEYETFKATKGELLLDTYIRYLQVTNDLKKCGYSKDNCELNFKFLNNLQQEWKQYATMMRQNKDLLVSKRKKKVAVSSESEGSDDKVKKITALLAKAFNQKKFYSKPTNNNLRTSSATSSANKKQDYVKSNDKKEEKKVDEKKRDMSKVSYYTSESESESEYETSDYYDNSTTYGLFVDNNDDQEIFHDSIEKFSDNLIESQIDHNESDVTHNDSKDVAKQTNKTVRMIMPSKDKMYNGRKGIGFENPSYFCKAKDLRPMLYDGRVIGLGYTSRFLIHSDEALEIEKFKRAREKKIKFAYDYGKNSNVITPRIFKLSVSQSVSPISVKKTSCASNSVESKLKRKRSKRTSSKQHEKQVNKDVLHVDKDFVHFLDLDTLSSVRRPKPSGNDKQHRKQIADQEILFDKMSRLLVELDENVRMLKNTVLEKDLKIYELEECMCNKDLEIEKCLERLNKCENKLHKIRQTNKTVRMIMPSKDKMYNGRKGIGFENPSYFCKAKDLRPMLYDGRVIGLGYTSRFLIHSDEALEIEKFKRAREKKIKFAYDYGSLNASYVNEKINFSDDYFQEIINQDFKKNDSPF
nr:hypothetical protein [Tanacetum cinerariifolium]